MEDRSTSALPPWWTSEPVDALQAMQEMIDRGPPAVRDLMASPVLIVHPKTLQAMIDQGLIQRTPDGDGWEWTRRGTGVPVMATNLAPPDVIIVPKDPEEDAP